MSRAAVKSAEISLRISRLIAGGVEQIEDGAARLVVGREAQRVAAALGPLHLPGDGEDAGHTGDVRTRQDGLLERLEPTQIVGAGQRPAVVAGDDEVERVRAGQMRVDEHRVAEQRRVRLQEPHQVGVVAHERQAGERQQR